MMIYEELIEQEHHAQSIFSPGIVQIEENLSRVLFTPKHVVNGKVLPVAFDPAIFNGLSVLRNLYDFENCLLKTINLLESDGIKYYGYTSANVNDIKNMTTENPKYRIFYILDTATSDRIGHADIHAIRSFPEEILPPKAMNNYIRFQISTLFTISEGLLAQ